MANTGLCKAMCAAHCVRCIARASKRQWQKNASFSAMRCERTEENITICHSCLFLEPVICVQLLALAKAFYSHQYTISILTLLASHCRWFAPLQAAHILHHSLQKLHMIHHFVPCLRLAPSHLLLPCLQLRIHRQPRHSHSVQLALFWARLHCCVGLLS